MLRCSARESTIAKGWATATMRPQSTYRLGLEGAGVGDGTIGGVVAGEAPACGKTGAPGAGTAGAFGFTGGSDADGCAVVCCLSNSLRSPVSRLVLCA